ncbi:MAG: hypothetical protein N3H30_00765 [Candidatus Micrarchaeota archaeon]|nr:hypothetical protein [Candidatus Micrarchaeota archaeon]
MQAHKQDTRISVSHKLPDVMAEGIMRKPRGFYFNMSDDELVKYALQFCARNDIKSRMQLFISDASLYVVLNRRKLLSSVIPHSRNKSAPVRWPHNNDRLLHIAKEYCTNNGIRMKGELCKSNPKLYSALRYRRLLDALGLKTKAVAHWSKMGDDELLDAAKALCSSNGITQRSELGAKFSRLYTVLTNRQLLDKVIPHSYHKRKKSKWCQLSDGELVEMGRDACLMHCLKSRTDLTMHYFSLYNELRKRRILDKVVPRDNRGRKQGCS